MLKRFLPREEGFFSLFEKSADLIITTTTRFYAMLHDLNNQQEHVDAIARCEEEGDRIAHTTFELLHRTFITPFDRHDIHHLTSRLDDILDLVNRCAQRFPFYQLNQAPTEMIRLAELGVSASKILKEAIAQLHSLKNSTAILQCCEEFSHIEREAHQTVLSGEKNLFLHENDFKQFIKLKEIYTQTKFVINRFEDVGNILKGIVLEYS